MILLFGSRSGNQGDALKRAENDRKAAEKARRTASRQPTSREADARFKRADEDLRKAKVREADAKTKFDRSKRGW